MDRWIPPEAALSTSRDHADASAKGLEVCSDVPHADTFKHATHALGEERHEVLKAALEQEEPGCLRPGSAS